MGAVTQLCSRAIWLDRGRCRMEGRTVDVIGSYLASAGGAAGQASFARDPDKPAQIVSVGIVDAQGRPAAAVPHLSGFALDIRYEVRAWPSGSYLCVDVFNEQDLRMVWSCDVASVEDMTRAREAGVHRAVAAIPPALLAPGRYFFSAAIFAPGSGTVHDVQERAVSVEVTDGGSLLSAMGIRNPALTGVTLDWQTHVPSEAT
jgi:hypothetical protein